MWVGVTVKPVSMQTLKNFDRRRYAPLSMDNPLPCVRSGQLRHAVPADSKQATENGLAWDIYSQVGELLRSTSSSNPIALRRQGSRRHGLKLYGFGYSQTGGYMYDYINGVAPLAMKQTGHSDLRRLHRRCRRRRVRRHLPDQPVRGGAGAGRPTPPVLSNVGFRSST